MEGGAVLPGDREVSEDRNTKRIFPGDNAITHKMSDIFPDSSTLTYQIADTIYTLSYCHMPDDGDHSVLNITSPVPHMGKKIELRGFGTKKVHTIKDGRVTYADDTTIPLHSSHFISLSEIDNNAIFISMEYKK